MKTAPKSIIAQISGSQVTDLKIASVLPEIGALVGPASVSSNIDSCNLVEQFVVSRKTVILPTGIFCFGSEGHPRAAQNGGLACVRVSLPPDGDPNVDIIGFGKDGWLSAVGDVLLVRVHRGPSQVLLSFYQYDNQPISEQTVLVRQLTGSEAPAAPAGPRPDVLAHVRNHGDIAAKFGEWVGESGNYNWIEGFAIKPPADIDPADLSYQAVLADGRTLPWVNAGAYCGSRGKNLPLFGLRVSLSGCAARWYELNYSSRSVTGSSVGPVGNDETCKGETAMEAFRVVLTPRGKPSTHRARRRDKEPNP